MRTPACSLQIAETKSAHDEQCCCSVIDMLQTSSGSDALHHCPSCNQGFKVPNGIIEIAADGEQVRKPVHCSMFIGA